MGRPKKAIETVSKKIRLPIDLVAKMELLFFSEVEQRVPYSAVSRYIESLIRKDFELRERIARGER